MDLNTEITASNWNSGLTKIKYLAYTTGQQEIDYML